MLTAFSASLLLILVSELGDKTFFVAAVLAMRYSHFLVFMGAFSGLALMAGISVALGQVARLFPKVYTHYGAIAILVIFGLLMLKQAWEISPETMQEEADEASKLVENLPQDQSQGLTGNLAILSTAFSLTFLAEWGDRTQIATIDLATTYPPLWVVVGAITGFAICVALAVTTGKLLANYLSPKAIALFGGILFLVFAGLSWLQGV